MNILKNSIYVLLCSIVLAGCTCSVESKSTEPIVGHCYVAPSARFKIISVKEFGVDWTYVDGYSKGQSSYMTFSELSRYSRADCP